MGPIHPVWGNGCNISSATRMLCDTLHRHYAFCEYTRVASIIRVDSDKTRGCRDLAHTVLNLQTGWPRAMPCHVMASRAMPGHIFACHAIFLRVMPCHKYAISIRVTPCHKYTVFFLSWPKQTLFLKTIPSNRAPSSFNMSSY